MDEVAAVALQTRMADLCGHLNVLHAQLVESVVEALDGELWQQWGVRSPEHWLAWQTGMSPARAKQLVDTARRAAELPVTFAAFADGELSVDQVVTVAKHTPAHNDSEVCELAKAATVSQLRSALSRYVHDVNAKPEPAPSAVVGDPGDYLSTSFDDTGRFAMHLNAPADKGALIGKAISEARDALFHAGQAEVTWLDALVEVCNRSLGTITSPARRDRYRVYLHLNTDDPGGPAHAWLNGGPTLPDAIRDVLCCDGVVQPVWHTSGLPINVGRSRYIVPERTRRLILDRDRTCRHPSCPATTHLEIHHILEWIANGCTDTDNLTALCPQRAPTSTTTRQTIRPPHRRTLRHPLAHPHHPLPKLTAERPLLGERCVKLACSALDRSVVHDVHMAPMGAVPDEIIIATFYNFSPRAVNAAMAGVWEAASPESWQAARFRRQLDCRHPWAAPSRHSPSRSPLPNVVGNGPESGVVAFITLSGVSM